jgi:hypothetical protein
LIPPVRAGGSGGPATGRGSGRRPPATGAGGEGQFYAVSDATCGACRVTQSADGSIGATIPGQGGASDTAYALLDFGGATGINGPVFVRESLSLGNSQAPASDLYVSQVADVRNQVLYRLVVSGASRRLRLASPPGAVNADALDIDTGVAVPNDGSSLRVSVLYDPAGTLVLKVNGQEVARRTGLTGGEVGPARFLAAGIVASAPTVSGASAGPLSIVHSGITAGPPAPGGGAPAATPPPKLSSGPPVTVVAPSIVAEPTVSGPAAVGGTLTAAAGTWSDAGAHLQVQWERCDASGGQCVDLPGATALTYTPAGDDVGLTLRVRVTATNSAGAGSAFSAGIGPVLTAGVPVAASPPSISGSALVGSVLTANAGTWTDAASFALAWERCDSSGAGCSPISGADGATYQLGLDDLGATIRLAVTATGRTATGSAVSDATAVVGIAAPVLVSAPTIGGAAVEGGTLVAAPGSWSDANAQVAYQWLRCDASGTCTPIDGATASSLSLTSADVGSTIQLVVTASNAGGSATATATSAVVAAAAGTGTPPDDGSGTPPDDGSGTTPPPDDGSGTTPPPDDGSGTTPPPDDGSGSQPPADGSGTQPAAAPATQAAPAPADPGPTPPDATATSG